MDIERLTRFLIAGLLQMSIIEVIRPDCKNSSAHRASSYASVQTAC